MIKDLSNLPNTSLIVLPAEEYKRLKEIEKRYNKLLKKLNI